MDIDWWIHLTDCPTGTKSWSRGSRLARKKKTHRKNTFRWREWKKKDKTKWKENIVTMFILQRIGAAVQVQNRTRRRCSGALSWGLRMKTRTDFCRLLAVGPIASTRAGENDDFDVVRVQKWTKLSRGAVAYRWSLGWVVAWPEWRKLP